MKSNADGGHHEVAVDKCPKPLEHITKVKEINESKLTVIFMAYLLIVLLYTTLIFKVFTEFNAKPNPLDITCEHNLCAHTKAIAISITGHNQR